jgi:hypothetical protein
MSLAQSFGRSAFARFINSPTGRVVRIVAGLGLIAWSYTQLGSGIGLAFMLVGLIPLATGVFDWCIISALLGGPLSGTRIRSGA